MNYLHKMPYNLLHRITLTLCLAGSIISCHAAGTDQPEVMDDETIMAFLDNPDALLGILDESATEKQDAGLDNEPIFLVSSSATGGIGHSNNFLKKNENLVSSDYLQFELDTFITWINERLEISIMAFAEVTLYAVDKETAGGTGVSEIPSDEVISFAQAKGVWSKHNLDLGIESSFMYASFIYDSSIPGVNASAGTRIRQLLPATSLYMDWYAPGSNRIRFGVSAARVEFNIANQDYWDPAFNTELEHIWSDTLKTTSSVNVSRQLYDDDYAKDQNGDPLNFDESLVVNRLAINQKLAWKPKQVKWLNMDISIGMAWDDEEEGLYEAMRQSWIRGQFIITNNWGRFKISGKWGEYRYDHRLNSRPDPRTGITGQLALQTNQSLAVEYSRSLRWGLEILARNQWDSLSSRTYRDNYSERRTELLLQWNY